MRARLTTVAVPIATATLALGTAAWAANGRLPLLPESDVRALAVTAQASGPLVANDQEGSAILRAEALAPGDTTTGEVTIRNAGDAAGAFSLSPSGATDSGAPPEGPLSGVLRLSVSDVTDGTPAPVYDGTLAAFARVGLGTFPAGAAHRYRFALTYPSGTPVDDNGYQGASASVAFDWDAVAVGSGSSTRAPTPATPTPTPGPTAEATGSGSAPSTTATRGTTTPATSAAAAAAIPASTATGRFKVSVGRVKERPVRGRRLYLWVQSTRASRTRVTATVSWRGHRAMTLRAQTVKAGAKRRTVRLRLPAAAVRGARHSLTMRVRAAATSGAGRASAKRTLRVRSR